MNRSQTEFGNEKNATEQKSGYEWDYKNRNF